MELDGGGEITYYVFKELKLVIAYFTIASSITIAGNYWYNYAIPSAVGVPAAHRDAPMVGGAGGNVGGMLSYTIRHFRPTMERKACLSSKMFRPLP